MAGGIGGGGEGGDGEMLGDGGGGDGGGGGGGGEGGDGGEGCKHGHKTHANIHAVSAERAFGDKLMCWGLVKHPILTQARMVVLQADCKPTRFGKKNGVLRLCTLMHGVDLWCAEQEVHPRLQVIGCSVHAYTYAGGHLDSCAGTCEE